MKIVLYETSDAPCRIRSVPSEREYTRLAIALRPPILTRPERTS